MSKFVKVMNGTESHANGFKYKIDEINIANTWNPNALNPKDFGGFNFSTEDKILRYLHRGNTIYDVIIPDNTEVVEIESKNAPHGIFRSNKIIITNPRSLTEEFEIELYKKSTLPEKTYYQCIVISLYKNHKEVAKHIIKDRIDDNNISDAIKEFEEFIVSKDNKKFDYNDLWDDAKEIYDILKEIENRMYINLYIDRDQYEKIITNDKVINLTGESGSGKSYFSKKYLEDDNYIVIDTDIVFSDKESDNKESLEIRNLFKNKSKDSLINDFDSCYKEILEYFKGTNKTLVIDSAQYRNIKDYYILKGKVIVMRTCIDTCYKRCLNRFSIKNPNATVEEKEVFANRKLGMYKWYKSLNNFIEKVDKL